MPFNVIEYAYRRFQDDNPILEMFADLHIAFYVEKAPSKNSDKARTDVQFPLKFLHSIMHKYAQKKVVSAMDQVYVCDYLGHSFRVGESLSPKKCFKCSRRMRDIESGSKRPLSCPSSSTSNDFSSSDNSDSDNSI